MIPPREARLNCSSTRSVAPAVVTGVPCTPVCATNLRSAMDEPAMSMELQPATLARDAGVLVNDAGSAAPQWQWSICFGILPSGIDCGFEWPLSVVIAPRVRRCRSSLPPRGGVFLGALGKPFAHVRSMACFLTPGARARTKTAKRTPSPGLKKELARSPRCEGRKGA